MQRGIRKWAASDRAALIFVLAAFVLSRFLYRALGVRFDARSLDWYWQFIDPGLLATRPLESLAHLHGQPPLFNAFLAAVLQLPERLREPAFAATFAVLGLALACGLFALQRELGVPARWSALATALFVASPAAALYENLLFYTYPVLVMLVWAALLLYCFCSRGRTAALVGFCALLAGLVLTRSLFHLAYLGAVLLGLAIAAGLARRRVVRWGGIALLIAGSWYAHSWLLFGSFSASSWMGMSLSGVFLRLATPAERADLAAASPTTGILAAAPFAPLATYAPWVPLPPPTGVPVLDQVAKAHGDPNFHHLAYVAVAERYRQAALSAIRLRPRLYLRGVATGWRLFFRSSADSGWLEPNAGRVEPVERWYRAALGQRRRMTGRAGADEFAWIFAAVTAVAVATALRHLRRESWRQARGATIAFMLFTIGYVALAGNALELGENNRFGFLVQPFVLALLMLLAAPGGPASAADSSTRSGLELSRAPTNPAADGDPRGV